MAVDHGRGQILVAKEFLDGADVVAVLEEMGCKGMPESVTARRFCDAGREHGLPDGTLKRSLVQKMSAALATFTVVVLPRGWEDPLPGPFARRVRVFLTERVGELDETGVLSQVAVVQRARARLI